MKAHPRPLLKVLFSTLFVLWLCSSCETNNSVTNESVINESFSGTKTKSIEFNSDSESHIYLTGTVEVDSGKVEVSVTTPSSITIYDRVIIKSKPQPLNTEFGTLYGTWILKYQSTSAKGNVNIKLGN